MLLRYCKSHHPSSMTAVASKSPTWKRFLSVRLFSQSQIFWLPGPGNISFWWHEWDPIGLLGPLARDPSSCSGIISDFRSPLGWDWVKIKSFLDPQVASSILNFPFSDLPNDTPFWKLSSNGSFTVSLAWNAVRSLQAFNLVFTLFWHNSFPATISNFWWKS